MRSSLATIIIAIVLSVAPRLACSLRIEKGGAADTSGSGSIISNANANENVGVSLSTETPQQQLSEEELQQLQSQHQTPPNIIDPDYPHPISRGGDVHSSGNDGAVIFVAYVHTTAAAQSSSSIARSNTVSRTGSNNKEATVTPPIELRSQYFLQENAIQEYIVPGNPKAKPYEQDVTIKVWGAGGGGCDGGE